MLCDVVSFTCSSLWKRTALCVRNLRVWVLDYQCIPHLFTNTCRASADVRTRSKTNSDRFGLDERSNPFFHRSVVFLALSPRLCFSESLCLWPGRATFSSQPVSISSFVSSQNLSFIFPPSMGWCSAFRTAESECRLIWPAASCYFFDSWGNAEMQPDLDAWLNA